MAKSVFGKSSIGRKILMALSGFFLMFFLLQHLTINFSSVVDPDTFNELSHFMGTNPVVQYLLQPVLVFAIIFHFVMGFMLEMGNKKARINKYAKNNAGANSTWMSRNMVYSGLTILAFLGLHFYDFWFPELKLKFIDGVWGQPTRYYPELVHKFHDPVRVALYCVSFVLLALHLLHGFASAFQSVGFNNKYTPAVKKFGTIFAIVVPLGFVFIALYHHLNH